MRRFVVPFTCWARLLLPLGAGLGVGLSACASPPPKSALNYTEESKKAYDLALDEFDAHNWIESQVLFREVKRKYAYSKYARMAELRIADADFEQEKFSEAVRGYRAFIHDHRADTDDVSYARSRIAEAQYREIGDSFLLPSTDERDQAAIQDAYRELRSYLADYPDAKESKRARMLLADVTARLVRHELYVAKFYLNRDNYDAAVARIQYALRNYSVAGRQGPPPGARKVPSGEATAESAEGAVVDSGLEPEALLLLGEVFLMMKKYGEARDAFVTIVRDYGASSLVIQAKSYLAYLKERGV
jgi:outer membrane protein assembly factor BamD